MTLLGATSRAYLTTERAARYAIGDPAAPLLTLNAVDAAGVLWWCQEPEGWRAPPAQTPIDRRQYGHGGYPGDTYLEERVLTFTGTAAAPDADAAQAAAERLLGAIYASFTADTLYTHLDESPPKTLYVRPASGEPKITFQDLEVFDFQFILVAPDPLKRGPSVTYGPIRLPAATGGPGRTYPRRYALVYGVPGSTPTQPGVTVPNAGTMDSHAVYTVTGPVPSPQIHLASGQYLALGLTLAATDTLVVDTLTGTVLVNGVSRLDVLLAGSTLPLIPPGGTEVRLGSLGGGTSQAAALTVTTAPTWK